MADSYDLQRYEGTGRKGDAKISTAVGEIKVRFFEIDEEFIEKDLRHQAADFAFFANKEIIFETELMNIKSEVSLLRSKLWSDIVALDPKLRVKDVEAAIDANVSLLNLRKRELELDHSYRQMVCIRKAFDMKSRMIQSKIGLVRSQIDKQIESSRSEVSERYSNSKA